MFTAAQNKTLNNLLSESLSFLVRAEGDNVAVLRAEKNLTEALIQLGFKQDVQCDKRGNFYGHSQWWNEEVQLQVHASHSNPGEWTIASENHVLAVSSMEMPIS